LSTDNDSVIEKSRSGRNITRGICDVPVRRDFPETGSGRRTIQRNIARRGGLFALSFMVRVERLDFGWNSALFQDSERRSLHATPVPQKVVPAGSATQKSPYHRQGVRVAQLVAVGSAASCGASSVPPH
ncbi:hypothetical protein THAOC_21472, partial [Thalassiosira oceanica]